MSKPDWLVEKERAMPHRFKKCINCRNKGEVCGLTNNLGKGRGRLKMYRCKEHPSIQFYDGIDACEDYE